MWEHSMPTWKQLTPIPVPAGEAQFWVNLDNACFISPGASTGAHIEFVSIDPVDVTETPDQIVPATGNWKELHSGSQSIFANVANITNLVWAHSAHRGGPYESVIYFALAPSADGPRMVGGLTVSDSPAQIMS
jgi:hypothetical protein